MPKAEQSLNDLLHEIRRIEQSREVLTEKKIRKIYKQLLKELNHFLADEYLKYSKDGILTVAMLQEKSRYAKFLEEIESHVNNLTPEIVALIKNTVEDTYTACYKGMSESVLKAKDTKSALNYLKDLNIRPEVMKRAIENPVSGLTLPDILEKNRKEVIYDIKQQVNIGLMNGDRYETTAKKVAERLDISYGKATNIVRTETHRVTESGFMDCAKDISDSLDGSGLVYTAAWRTMKDERVRPQHRYRTKSGWKTSINRNGANHQKMEGVIIQVGDKFQIEPNVYAECPSTSGTARNDCRCRCFLEYTLMSVEKFEELTGKSVDKSGGSGIIEENSKKAITPISDKAVERVPKVQISGYTDEQCKFIQSQHQELLKYSRDNNENKEVAFVFDNNLSNRKEFTGSDDKLDFGSSLYGKDLFVMHNHPRNSSYSATDMVFFMQNSNVKSFSIVKNNGAVEVLTKSDKFDSAILKKDFERIIKKTVKSKIISEYDKAVKKLLEKHSQEGDMFEWIK